MTTAGPGSGPDGAPTAIALSPILSARYRSRDLERIRAAAPGARLVTVSIEGLADGPLDDVDDGFAADVAGVERLAAGCRIERRAVELHFMASVYDNARGDDRVEDAQPAVVVVQALAHDLASPSAGSTTPASANPRARSTQLSHCRHGRPSGSGS